MHHQDFTGGDPPGPGSRKSSFHYRRGSSSGAPAAMDDNPGPASGSSSPGLHHQQPPSQAAGSQLKKKSGFQITSVTSAQINVSGNNSLADDTESYDDMDESHTEDLSSSDILDVSVSRATDTGQPERSSSDETLNSLHGVDTPGLVSPNEPLHPQGSVQGMVNGMVHPPHYPQQQGHHHSDSLGGGEPSLPVVPIGSSSPAMVQRQPMLDNTKPLAPVVGGGMVTDLQGNVAVAALPPSAPAGFDNSTVSGQAGGPGPPAAAAPTPNPQTQAAPGSRFRVVKLDTNSEPFRKGRWTCTEYYEKEVPHSTPAEVVPKSGGADVATAETESAGNPGNIVQAPPHPAVQPPHTLQPYPPQQNQDFTSPQGAQTQSPPQGLAQPTPLAYASPQDVAAAGGAHLHKPVALLPTLTPQPPPTIPQQLPYAVEGGYPAPQLQAAGMAMGSVRQPDFIQPTAPFQTQVQQPPLPHNLPTGIPMIPGQGVPATQPLVGMQLVNQAQVAPPPAQATFAGQPQPPSSAPVLHPYMPLTAALQPLLNPGGGAFPQAHGGMSSMRSSHLEDAQRLLLQHQGLLALPRLGAAAGGEGAVEAGGPAGTLAHMGMSAEASAFMAAAAGLRAHAEGEEDSSSGASVVAIDNKIEQAMDLVKSHLMYAVREEVEVLKEQIKELMERNTQLEQENNLLKNLASPEQMAQFQAQVQIGGSPTGTQPALPPLPGANTATQQALPSTQQSSTQQSA